MSRIRIEMTAHARGRVFIDEVELKNVVSIQFSAALMDVNLLRLELNPTHVEITGIADVIQHGEVAGDEPG